MPATVRRVLSLLLVCLLVALPSRPAKADSLQNAVIGAAVGVAVAGALIGVGIYYAVTHNHHVTGCASTTPDGLELLAGDGTHYKLIGDLDAVHPGDRVKLSGKKRAGKDKQPTFLVEKLGRDYGVCKTAAPASTRAGVQDERTSPAADASNATAGAQVSVAR